jgi:hypothetical protein
VTTAVAHVATPVEAHSALTQLWTDRIRPHTRAGGAGVLTWQTASTYLRLKHRGLFHGPVLEAFSEQVWFRDDVSGVQFRYSKEAWKHYLKVQFCPAQLEEYTTRAGEVKVRRRKLSTEALSDDEYGDFLDQVVAFGIELGIEFPEREE